ncbi:MAG: phosphoribosylamine--glycine ligase [Phycisphaeraceae bacterium]|nr:phosphoribosylamine--glycine ligase [Phycisphaeraceae bacterium]
MPNTSPINVLLVGGGGREHALARGIARSPRLRKLWVTHPRNPGLADLGHAIDVQVSTRDIYRLESFCDREKIDLVVIGPEDPLADGWADRLATPDRLVFGPTRAGAQIEADKSWAKQLMRAGSIPTAEARSFTDPLASIAYIESRFADDPAVASILDKIKHIARPEDRRATLEAALRLGKVLARREVPPSSDLTLLTARIFPDGPATPVKLETVSKTARAYYDAWVKPRRDLPVLKAAGLAKGKGVILPSSLAEAADAVRRVMVEKAFGDAGKTLVIEERLTGPEVSVLALVDGRTIMLLPVCQDHKRLGDGDTGPNTGGMGAYCPADIIDAGTLAVIEREILVPTVDSLRREGIEYRGVLYAGLMLTHAGPKVLEFNCRFGDPECQPLMARFRGDLITLLEATALGRLDRVDCSWDPRAACCVVLASEGYPDEPRTGQVITGLDEAESLGGVVVDHAGTARDASGRIVTAGGRVLGVTALGDDLPAARARAYEAVERIRFPGMQYRRDIAAGAVAPKTVAQPGA